MTVLATRPINHRFPIDADWREGCHPQVVLPCIDVQKHFEGRHERGEQCAVLARGKAAESVTQCSGEDDVFPRCV